MKREEAAIVCALLALHQPALFEIPDNEREIAARGQDLMRDLRQAERAHMVKHFEYRELARSQAGIGYRGVRCRAHRITRARELYERIERQRRLLVASVVAHDYFDFKVPDFDSKVSI